VIRIDRAHPLVPAAIATGAVAAMTIAYVIAPVELRGPALLAAASAVLIGSFLAAPKPTLVVFALTVLLYDTIAFYVGPSIKQIDEVCIPAFVLIAALRIRPWRRPYLSPARDLAAGAVFGLAIISSVVNGVPLGTWLPGLLLLVKVIAFLYLVMWQNYEPVDLRQIGVAVVSVGLVAVSLGYVGLLDPSGFRAFFGFVGGAYPRGQLPSINSIFQHPEMLAWFGTFVSLFAFGYYVVFRRWWLLAAGLFFATTAILTARRRAILGVIVGLLAGLAAQVRARIPARQIARHWLPVGAGIFVLGLLFLPGLSTLLNQTVGEFRPPGSDPPPVVDAPPEPGLENARLAIYYTSVDVARDYFPLGAGLGRYGSWMSRVDYSPLYETYGLDRVYGLSREVPGYITDTFWPQILGEIGVFGLLAYVAFVGVVGLQIWNATQLMRQRDPFLYAFCLATVMVFFHALVETVFSSLFHSPPKVYLIFGAMGIALALLRQATTADATQDSAPTGAEAENLTGPGATAA